MAYCCGRPGEYWGYDIFPFTSYLQVVHFCEAPAFKRGMWWDGTQTIKTVVLRGRKDQSI